MITNIDFQQIAKEIITRECEDNHLSAVKIILFGSRAKGTATTQSDWDFFVVIDQELTFTEKARVAAKIRRKIAAFNHSSDIIIKSSARYLQDREISSLLSYDVHREGIPL